MRWLEEEVTRITGKNDQMMKENLLLRHVLEEQAGKINELVRRNEKREAALKSDVKSEPAVEVVAPVKATPAKAPKKAAIWRPGVEEETPVKAEPAVAAAPSVTEVTRENLVQMRLQMPTATPAAATLPYAAMLEQVNIFFQLFFISLFCTALNFFLNLNFQHSRSALPFYNLAGLAHGYNSLAQQSTLTNGNFSPMTSSPVTHQTVISIS